MEKNMANPKFDKEITALPVIDPHRWWVQVLHYDITEPDGTAPEQWLKACGNPR